MNAGLLNMQTISKKKKKKTLLWRIKHLARSEHAECVKVFLLMQVLIGWNEHLNALVLL